MTGSIIDIIMTYFANFVLKKNCMEFRLEQKKKKKETKIWM